MTMNATTATTMPAIAPPDRLFPLPLDAEAGVVFEFGLVVAVAVASVVDAEGLLVEVI